MWPKGTLNYVLTAYVTQYSEINKIITTNKKNKFQKKKEKKKETHTKRKN